MTGLRPVDPRTPQATHLFVWFVWFVWFVDKFRLLKPPHPHPRPFPPPGGRENARAYRPNACRRAPWSRSQARCGRGSNPRAFTCAQNSGPWFGSSRWAHSWAAT